MKDSIIRWIISFTILAVIAVAAIFAVDNDEEASEFVQERFQTLENEDDNHTFLDKDERFGPKSEFQRDKSKKKFDRRDEFKKKKSKDKFDRVERGSKSKKDKSGMSKPLPPMRGEMDEWHRNLHDHHMAESMMGEGFMPMMGEGFMPPMMGEGFEIRESEIFKEIEQIFDSIIDSLASIEELNSVGSKATDEGISQSGELTLGLIEELIKETFDERIQEEIPELVDRVAKDAITQIIEGLTQANVEQSLEKTTESN